MVVLWSHDTILLVSSYCGSNVSWCYGVVPWPHDAPPLHGANVAMAPVTHLPSLLEYSNLSMCQYQGRWPGSQPATCPPPWQVVRSGEGPDHLLVSSSPRPDQLMLTSRPGPDHLMIRSTPGLDHLTVRSWSGIELSLTSEY